MTLPVIVWEKRQIPIPAEEKGELSHKEKVVMFKADFFNMNADINLEKREQFLLVVDMVLAKLAAQSPGLAGQNLLGRQAGSQVTHHHRLSCFASFSSS
jgi:hypothetical protein